MRSSLLIGMLGMSLGFAACGGAGGKANKEDLAKAVVDALAKKDKAAFVGLYVTVEQGVSACSELEPMKAEVAGKLAKSIAKASESFDECAQMDWGKAKLGAVSGGEAKKRQGPCESFKDLKDIEFEADIDGKKVRVQLDDPIALKDAYFLRDRFRCRTAANEGTEDGMLVADGKTAELAKPPEPAAAPAPTEAPPAPSGAAKAADQPADPTAAPVDPATAPPTTAPAATGASECDKFIAAYETCLQSMPETVRTQAAEGLKQMKQTFAGIGDKAMLDSVCKQSYESTKKALSSMCPNAFK